MSSNRTDELELRDEVASLRERLAELSARLMTLEGGDYGSNGDSKMGSRRDVLKLAGAAALGAAGTLVMRVTPAVAATGGNMVLGQTNDANTTTSLTPTANAAPAPLYAVLGQFAGTPPANAVTDLTNRPVTVPVLLAVGPDGVFPNDGAAPTPASVYPGHAPIQGIGGPVQHLSGAVWLHVAEGVNGFAAQALGDGGAFSAGVVGESDNGIGIVGSGALDVAAFGAGYIAQSSITDFTGATNIAGPPPPPQYDFEQARDKDGVLWLSTALNSWRRMNTVIPINPVRAFDTRSSQGGPGRRPAGSVTNIQIANAHGVPGDAIGVFGNLTALAPAADGALTMYPAGAPLGTVNNLNYTRGVSAVSNFVMVPLGTNGQVSVYVSANGATDFLFDIAGYIQ